ncbi:MAG: UvrD-helicase domain-containing protein [candidate division Zixibacteria bacterium]|nr:UvrD-helicase domain-containing protein [candidate division Zixibacteria bacterium]
MEFRIADTFTDSLAKLTGDEQKAVKTNAFDLQMSPANPGLQFHKLSRAKDKNFWSIRVNRDVRLIVHKTESSLMLCYVGHHDKAYDWAERRKLETHPRTGAAQFVEIRETVREITIPKYVEAETQALIKPPLFTDIADDELLGYGVPVEWLNDVRNANEDTLLELADHLPAEAAEALLNLATGQKPEAVPTPAVEIDPFEHPDAQRRFRIMSNVEELERALEYPWEKWTVFLHPAQQQLVEKDYNGPARVSGSAGTGKTIVALHRAVYLARRDPDSRVLLTTFSDTLANSLRTKLRRLISNEPRIGERLEVHSLDAIGRRLYAAHFEKQTMATYEEISAILQSASTKVEDHKFSLHFLKTEWEQVVDAWQLNSWEEYRNVARLGRKTRLPENRRVVLWSIFDIVKSELKRRELVTYPEIFSRLTTKLIESSKRPFDFVVIDEAQDISVPQLRFLAALGGDAPNRLFFAGDLGQRIFQQPFSWKALGVDIRGRSRTLRINYRTSHQIRMQADRLLAPKMSDVDGNIEDRGGTVSVFNGPKPEIGTFATQENEIAAITQWLSDRSGEGFQPHEIGVFVRSPSELDRSKRAVERAKLKFKVLDDNSETVSGQVSISTMHLAKGLEFRAVAVMACDDDVVPLQERIEKVTDDSDLEDVYNTERHLLYVACTRARDNLLVTGVEPASEFLDDLNES